MGWPPWVDDAGTSKRDAARHRYNNFNQEDLRCYGCAHSSASDPWPGRPSGERPCQFCIRNPLHVQNVDDEHTWYDGSQPVSIPMDAYQTPDMRLQVGQWLDDAEHAGERAVEALLRVHDRLAGFETDD